MAWLTIISGGSIKAQDFVPDISHVDTLATSICGDLHGYTQNLQDRYASKQGGNSTDLPDEEDWNPNAVFQCGSFTVYYSDFDEDVLGGFADPSFGEARRTTFCEVLNYVESVIDIHPNANPVIGVDNSYFNSEGHYAPPETGFLANANPFYSLESGHHFGVDAGIYDGFLSRHIQTGIDPDPNLDYDGRMQVNFHQTNVNSINNINY